MIAIVSTIIIRYAIFTLEIANMIMISTTNTISVIFITCFTLLVIEMTVTEN